MIIKIVNLNYSSTPTIFHEFKMIDTIRDFSLAIEPGKIYGLVGSIGSGGWLLSYILAGREVHSLMDQIYSLFPHPVFSSNSILSHSHVVPNLYKSIEILRFREYLSGKRFLIEGVILNSLC
ncbi:hypothetical protein [Paenibacillus anseongense]|uniref:hypothetical protein n=1 Tax=Paenibacillus anseongense TaxID=2682845 RepID=UPI002DBF5993|nr:hypothetical protein [Paenibacillus anseongense]MEC0264542.1 hypothetical protein [Paenibacillus anseongense]